MVTRADEATIDAAALGDGINLMVLVSTVGYAEVAAKCGASTPEFLLECVSSMKRFLGRVKQGTRKLSTTGTPTLDIGGADEALTDLALFLSQVPLDVAAVQRRARAFSECMGLVPPQAQ